MRRKERPRSITKVAGKARPCLDRILEGSFRGIGMSKPHDNSISDCSFDEMNGSLYLWC
jgi:hypothetical protein